MNDWLQIILLGIIQGVTEFLPVSSSGHLVVAQKLFGTMPDVMVVNIMLHAGTLAAILVFYWKRILRLLGEDRRVIGLIVVGSIPLGLVGGTIEVILDDSFKKDYLESPVVAGCCFLVTAGLLIWSSRRKPGEIDYPAISYRQSFIIGLFQAIAILPGISRSGSTIAAGLLLGMRREAAATFSFLLAIPAIGGVTAITLLKLINQGSSATGNPSSVAILAVGALVSFIVGLVSLAWLINWVRRGKLHYFALWLVPMGIAVLIWQATL